MRIWFTLLLLSSSAWAGDQENLYRSCQEQVRAGAYLSRYYSMACPEYFQMPDPSLYKCLKILRDKNAKPADFMECRYFCLNNRNWGPWYDFEIELEMKGTFEKLRGLYKNDQCFIDICPDLSGTYDSENSVQTIASTKGDIFRSYAFNGQAPLEATGARKFGANSYRAYCTDRSLTIEHFDDAGKVAAKTKFTVVNKDGDLKEESGEQSRLWKKRKL